MKLQTALCKLSVHILIGHPRCPCGARAEIVKCGIKLLPDGIRTQHWTQLCIMVCPSKLRIQAVIYKDLHAIHKAIVSDTKISIITI